MTNIDRRSALGRIGVAGIALLAGSRCGDNTPTGASSDVLAGSGGTASELACVLTPSLTEGPYYIDAGLVRRDITEGRPGAPLELVLTVVSASSCSPIESAIADVWHCDASGAYSGFASEGTSGQRFLRGVQVTNASGQVGFDTLYPGWYSGRTVHIHLKILLSERTAVTTQLFFPESVTDEVYAASPYSARPRRTTTNASDGIFSDATVLDVVAAGSGYRASLTIGIA